jgi:Zn-dependent protease
MTVARVQAIEISLTWRWAPVVALGTWLLAQSVLPARFPGWDMLTSWLIGGGAVLAGEVALLLHEVSHAVVARCYGQRVTRIVFHGFVAETIVQPCPTAWSHEIAIALAGPALNIVLAALAGLAWIAMPSQGPVDVLLLMLVLGNAAAAVMSLLPLGASDGARVLRAVRAR